MPPNANTFIGIFCTNTYSPIIDIFLPDGNLPCPGYRLSMPIRESATATAITCCKPGPGRLCCRKSGYESRRIWITSLIRYWLTCNDYVGWHSDNEPELGEQSFIASLTFGAERGFEFRHKQSSEHGRLLLPSGALLIMQPDFQHDWLHSVPIDQNITEERINLTFRNVVPVISASTD
jgi:hypothetical protein